MQGNAQREAGFVHYEFGEVGDLSAVDKKPRASGVEADVQDDALNGGTKKTASRAAAGEVRDNGQKVADWVAEVNYFRTSMQSAVHKLDVTDLCEVPTFAQGRRDRSANCQRG